MADILSQSFRIPIDGKPITIIDISAVPSEMLNVALSYSQGRPQIRRLICVVTQRPSDLAEGLLSQCNALFALRMTNQDDQAIIRDAVPEASHGLMNFLPALRNGEAIVVGEGVSMPMRVYFAPLVEGNSPKSATASFSAAWSNESGDLAEIEQTIDRWRRGVRHNSASQ